MVRCSNSLAQLNFNVYGDTDELMLQLPSSMGFPHGSVVKNLPTMRIWGNVVQSPGQEDPLEDGMATHSNILAWRIPWTEEPGGLQSIESQRVRHDWSDLERMHSQVICLFL